MEKTNIEKAKNLIIQTLDEYNKSFIDCGDTIQIEDTLCRVFFVKINAKTQGLKCWYLINAVSHGVIHLELYESEQLN